MWHEARRQERRIRGMIVDYRKRAERRQDFYEKIQADPTQFIQIHGRRCKIHLDPAVAAAGDGAAIIVPWQGNQDNLIDRFDVRAHLDYIAPVSKNGESDLAEISQEERQCNYERYRILAQNDFLNVTEDKFLHQLYLEEQYGANAQLEAERNLGKKKPQPQKTGVTIGYSYEESESMPGTQPFSHLINIAAPKSVEKDSESESDDSEMDMDVSIDISKLDTSQAHELNGCGRNYGMLSNDFYSYLTKDVDEADALRIAREEEHEKMLLSGRKSRRERRAQKERRIACRPLSPPSYAAKEESIEKPTKDEESESRSPSPDINAGKITYITSFGGEDEMQPHSKISITLNKGSTQTLGESCMKAYSGTSIGHATYAQKVKENLEKLKKLNESTKHSRNSSERRGRKRSLRRSRSRNQSTRYRGRRLSTISRSRDRERKNRTEKQQSRSRSRSRHRSISPDYYSRKNRSQRRYHQSHHRSSHRSCYRSSHSKSYSSSSSTPSTRSSSSSSPLRSSLKRRYSRDSKYPRHFSRSHSRDSCSLKKTPRDFKRITKSRSPVLSQLSCDAKITIDEPQLSITSAAHLAMYRPTSLLNKAKSTTITPIISVTLPTTTSSAVSSTIPSNHLFTVTEPPPPPLKRYYGRKRGTDSSSELDSDSNDDKFETQGKFQESENNGNDSEERLEVDTTSEKSNPLPSISTSSNLVIGKQTSKYTTAQAKNPSFSYAPETKSSGLINLRERLKRKMQNLLNKQYKADKRAEIEKSERERQLQQEREDEMRELALKLRRRQRELRHKYGTPSSDKAEESDEESDSVPPRRKSPNTEKSNDNQRNNSRDRGKTQLSRRTYSRSRSSDRRNIKHIYTRSRSRQRSISRRRWNRSPSKSQYQRSSREHSSRYESDNRRGGDSRVRLERDRYEHRRDNERNYDYGHCRDRDSYRDRDRNRYNERDYERDRGRERNKCRDRSRERDRNQSRSTTIGDDSASSSRSKVVISAPPKLKKLVDY